MATSTSLWLLIIGAVLQLIGVVGYLFNRDVTPLPWWIPTLVILGWILLVVGIFYVYSDNQGVLKIPGLNM